MLKKDLLEKIKNAKDDEDINLLLAGTDIETSFKGDEPTLDVFKSKIKTEQDFKSFMDSECDKYSAKAIKTMKEKGTWESEFANELHAKYPNLITDPKDKELLEMKNKIAEMEAKDARNNLLKDALKYASEKGIPNKFVEKFLGEDLNTTKANLDEFQTEWDSALEKASNDFLSNNSHIPGIGGDSKVSVGQSMAQINNSVGNSNNAPDLWGNN